jgi:hypothetical protein
MSRIQEMGAVFVPRPRPNYSKIVLPNLPCVDAIVVQVRFCTWALSRPSFQPSTFPFAMIRPHRNDPRSSGHIIRRLETLPAQGPACGYT